MGFALESPFDLDGLNTHHERIPAGPRRQRGTHACPKGPLAAGARPLGLRTCFVSHRLRCRGNRQRFHAETANATSTEVPFRQRVAAAGGIPRRVRCRLLRSARARVLPADAGRPGLGRPLQGTPLSFDSGIVGDEVLGGVHQGAFSPSVVTFGGHLYGHGDAVHVRTRDPPARCAQQLRSHRRLRWTSCHRRSSVPSEAPPADAVGVANRARFRPFGRALGGGWRLRPGHRSAPLSRTGGRIVVDRRNDGCVTCHWSEIDWSATGTMLGAITAISFGIAGFLLGSLGYRQSLKAVALAKESQRTAEQAAEALHRVGCRGPRVRQ
jgi:hypothetical protein